MRTRVESRPWREKDSAKMDEVQLSPDPAGEGEDATDGGTTDCAEVDVDKLRDLLCEVLDGMSADLGNLLQSGTLDSFSSELFAAKLISSAVNETPDFKKIMREFETSMKFMSHPELEEHCRGFLQALRKSGGSGGPTSKAAEKLEEEWSEVVLNELGIHFIKTSYQATEFSKSNSNDSNTHETDAATVADNENESGGRKSSWSSNAMTRDTSLTVPSIGHRIPYDDHHHRTDPYPSNIERPTHLPRDISLPIMPDSIAESREQESCSPTISDLVSAQRTQLEAGHAQTPKRLQEEMVNPTPTLRHSLPVGEEPDKLAKLEEEMSSLKNTVKTQDLKQDLILSQLTGVSAKLEVASSEGSKDTIFDRLETKMESISDALAQMRERNSIKKETMKREYKDVIERVISNRDRTILELKVVIVIAAVVLVMVLYCFYSSFISRVPSCGI